MEPMTVGALLRCYRAAAGLTQEALAARAALSARSISDLERGLSRAPRFETLALLARALGLAAEERAALFRAARPPSPGGAAPPPAPTLQTPPLPPTALLGRESELTRAIDLVLERGARLLTVTGPGGVGKTRFALELALALRDRVADALAWIDLGALRDPALVPQAVAQALGLHEAAGQAFPAQVRAFLGDKQVVLFLDTFEHLPDAADFVAELLRHAPRLCVVVTSRTPLRLRAEHQLALPPLAPDAAAALFRERARRVRPDLDDDALAVAAICERVDRLPLAIELAAVHVKALPLPVLLARLTDGLGLLRGGARDLPRRQRTMREAIAWSYNLLSRAQRRWFRALGVFAGGCTLAAAEAICQGAGRDGPAAAGGPTGAAAGAGYGTIAALVDANLVRMETLAGAEDGLPRYSMLDVIRAYALDRLRAMGEEDAARRRHAAYVAVLAEGAGRAGPGQGGREDDLLREEANGRAALRWAHERGEAALGLRLATWFGRLWLARGRMAEGDAWLQRMLTLDAECGDEAAPPGVRVEALCWAARLALHLGRADHAAALAGEARGLAERLGDQAATGTALALLGGIALAAGEDDVAAAHSAESYAAATRAREPVGMALALLNLGELARKRGEVARATTLLEEALACVRAIELTYGIANVLTLLGHLARQQGDYARAKGRYGESLALYHQLGNATFTAWCLEGVAGVAGAEGDHRRAARLSGAAAALRAVARTPLPPREQEDVDRSVLTARAELAEEVFAEEWRAGLAMAQGDAVADALGGLPSTALPWR